MHSNHQISIKRRFVVINLVLCGLFFSPINPEANRYSRKRESLTRTKIKKKDVVNRQLEFCVKADIVSHRLLRPTLRTSKFVKEYRIG